LLDALVGVIVAVKPVIVTKAAPDILNVVGRVVLTTCNTDPTGILALAGTPVARLALFIWLNGI
jgi:hypothetical protein